MKMSVTCGTDIPTTIDVDLDKYDIKRPTRATTQEQVEAFELLKATMDDETFADDHCRNEDAVNGCIALHVLGYNPKIWFAGFAEEYDRYFFTVDLNKFAEHVDRVCDYLEKWGPAGNEGRALDFVI